MTASRLNLPRRVVATIGFTGVFFAALLLVDARGCEELGCIIVPLAWFVGLVSLAVAAIGLRPVVGPWGVVGMNAPLVVLGAWGLASGTVALWLICWAIAAVALVFSRPLPRLGRDRQR